jgi:hypothetical protein
MTQPYPAEGSVAERSSGVFDAEGMFPRFVIRNVPLSFNFQRGGARRRNLLQHRITCQAHKSFILHDTPLLSVNTDPRHHY